MPTKRKLEYFDPNKSDSNDTDFEPDQLASKRTRKQPRKRSGNSRKRPKRPRYRGSDVSDNEDDNDSLLEDSFSESSEDEELELNPATGRSVRKAARKTVNYEEKSGSDAADNTGEFGSKPSEQRKKRLKSQSTSDEDEEDDVKPTATKARTRMVTLKIHTPHRIIRTGTTARTTRPRGSIEPLSAGLTRSLRRAQTVEADEPMVVPLTPGRRSFRKGHSLEPASRSKPNKGPKESRKLTPTTEEVNEISSGNQEAKDTTIATDFADSDYPEESSPKSKEGTQDVKQIDHSIANSALDEEKSQIHEELSGGGDDEEDEDQPITKRRRRGTGTSIPATQFQENNSAKVRSTSQRQTRRSTLLQQGGNEVGSDFEPPDDASEDEVSASDTSPKKKSKEAEIDNSPGSTARRTRNPKSKSNSQSRGALESSDDELDQDEIAEELHDLKETTQKRRKMRRKDSGILYERTGRARTKVDYTIKPLDQIYAADDDAEDDTPNPTRRTTGGRNTASQPWERNLFSTFGPFGGGGGPSPVIGGPWGTEVVGGVDSDSSDDETLQRPTGAVGLTPTSAVAPGLLPGLGQANNLDTAGGLSGNPANLGKIKSQKSLADADPLGVDQDVDFSKVGGLEGYIDQLKEMVQMPLLYPELFSKFHVTPPRGVLFHGPPGTGKTLLARALAASVGSGGQKITFYMRKGADALSKWVGEAERQLRLLFDEARKTQPSIIFFDEIDGLAPVRSSKQEQIHASIVSTLLALMDGMDGRGQVIVIGATNRPDNIDPALRRPGRFDREFYFPLPDMKARQSILKIHTKDWGIDENFVASLAQVTKGYGGADLRALCTEAALNSIQRTYPQIYSSIEKLRVDADKIKVTAKDFMISIQRIIPSSERSASAGAAPLPKSVEPLLHDQLKQIESILDGLIPLKKKTTALQEAMYEQYEEEDYGFGRETMERDFERSRVFRPRLLIQGEPGMGQTYIGSAILNHFEGLHVQNFDLSTIYSDSTRSPEAALVQLFTEVKRHKPSVIYLPGVDNWYQTLNDAAIMTFLGLLRSIPPTDPILVLGITDTPSNKSNSGLIREIFGYSRYNRFTINRPSRSARTSFFTSIGEYVKKSPKDFPEPLNRKKRKLEVLELAPLPEDKAPTREEIDAQKKKDHQLLNLLKVAIQPIMDQIQKKYKKFRSPVIPQSAIKYIFDEKDPDFVRADIATLRPYEIGKDKDGVIGLREVASGKFFYNLETTTIEERLSNGFYARPKDFLADIRSLAKDAKRVGDKERTLKAQELLANVEVDIALIEQNPIFSDCENLYIRQHQRAKEKEAKLMKRDGKNCCGPILEPDAPLASINLGLSPHENPSPRTSLASLVIPHTSNTTLDGSLVNGGPVQSRSFEDVVMGGTDKDVHKTMQPPLQPLAINRGQNVDMINTLSQVSQQVVFKETASETIARDPLHCLAAMNPMKKSDTWGARRLNGLSNPMSSSPAEKPTQDFDIPDTQRNTQVDTSDEWPASQAHPATYGAPHSFQAPTYTNQPLQTVSVPLGSGSHQQVSKSHPTGMANLLNDLPLESSSFQSTPSNELILDSSYIQVALTRFVDGTSGCSIEQLERINRELMNGLWSMRGEWNRTTVMSRLVSIFNETLCDIEEIQRMIAGSQLELETSQL